MTDTDLFTAGESTDGNQPSNSVTTDTPDVKTNVSVGSLSTMVLPELRALANQAGVKGTSGMRKNELIAAIQESRGQANGVSAAGAPPEGSDKSPTATAEAPAAQGEQKDSATEGPRRERRGAARETGSATRTADDADRESSGTRDGKGSGEAGNRQGGQQDTKTDERGKGADSDQSGEQQTSGGQQNRGGDEDGEGRQGRRGRRFRDRDRRRRGERSGDGADAELREDDVVQPVAGILDVLD
ncbi:MAG TPA: Rho termination factor N-terminal domain-containing protein, partial [Mycobacterium sp.]|nr:Rho termination factor N-terminal domain-containing protein [Mycobacterium sp.]